jgi:peptidoglycan/LPS O-acetylase OafA/YrhL
LFDPVYFREWYPTVGLAAIGMSSAAIIACVVTNSSSVLGWVLSWRWLRWVGALSYSLYLWHVPAIRVVENSPLGQWTIPRILASVALSFVLATASYRYVEQPFLRRRKRYERLRSTKADAEATAQRPRRHFALPSIRSAVLKAQKPG